VISGYPAFTGVMQLFFYTSQVWTCTD